MSAAQDGRGATNNRPAMAAAGGHHTAFFYGTLMALPVLYRVLWGTPAPSLARRARLTIHGARLDGYCRHTVRGCDYPGIVVARDGDGDGQQQHVRGRLVSGLTDADLARLDVFEGPQYERRRLRVAVLASISVDYNIVIGRTEADTYVFLHPDDLLPGDDWDFVDFERNKMGRFIGAIEPLEPLESEMPPKVSFQFAHGFLGGGSVGGSGVGGSSVGGGDKIPAEDAQRDPKEGEAESKGGEAELRRAV